MKNNSLGMIETWRLVPAIVAAVKKVGKIIAVHVIPRLDRQL